MSHWTVRFTHAIARAPGPEIVDGLRAADVGAPDLAAFRRDHGAYVEALAAEGVAVTLLPPLPGFPDASFVEDAAICLPEAAILTRPGAPSRFGEAAAIAPALRRFYPEVIALDGPGFVEGGDVLATGRGLLVGRSARTDAEGIAALAGAAGRFGHAVREVATPPGVLHFKTDCALIDPETVLATRRLAASGCFEGFRVLHVPEGEEAAANCIRVNGAVIAPAGFPRTAETLRAAGYVVRVVGNAEAAKLDGGMSCLSLRFTPPE